MKLNHSKPEIPETVLMQWQAVADILAKTCQVPAALVMKVHTSEIEVFVSARADDNPYERGEKAPLNTGLYCEEVMRRRDKLLVPDALQDPKWDHNPDIRLGMISYLGYPLIWPDGEVFGTLCILDNKENAYSADIHELMQRFREVVETSMAFLWESERLRLTEEELRQSEERNRFLAGVIERSSQPFGTGYPDGRLGVVNRAFCDLTGYTEEELRQIDWNTTLTPPEWRESEMRHLTELERTGKPVRYEKEYIRHDGSRVPIELLVHVVRGETSDTLHYEAFVTDLTERKRAEKMLIRAMQDWEDIFQAIGHVTLILDLEGTILSANQAARKALGKSEEEVIGKKCYELFHGLDHHPGGCPLAKLRLTGEVTLEEMEVEALGGTYLVTCTPLVEASGTVQRVIHIATDITERRQAEKSLRESEHLFRIIFDEAPLGIALVGLDYRLLKANKAYCDLLGYSEEELCQLGLHDFTHPDDVEENLRLQGELGSGKVSSYQMEKRFIRKDGETTVGLLTASLLSDDAGVPQHFVGTVLDITDRKMSEALHRVRLNLLEYSVTHSADELLQKTLDEIGSLSNSPIGFYHFMSEDEKVLTLQAWSTRTVKEFCRAEGKGRHYPVDQAGVWVDCVHQRKPVVHNDYFALPHRKGMPERHAEVIRELVVPTMRSGKIVAILGIGNKPTDYTEKDVEIVSYLADVAWEIANRKRAEEALKERDMQYRALFEESMDGVYSVLRDGTITDANPSFCKLFSYTREEMIGKDIRELYFDPSDCERFREEIEKKGFVKDYEITLRKRDGTEVDSLISSSVFSGEDGGIIGYRGIVRDLTARRVLQKQLQQAQKMEAIGTLAGGIAHDFNNILQVVLGYSELVVADEGLPARLKEDVEKILLSGRNGADLVQRLLTFSRKTEINPLDLDLNQRIVQIRKFLERTIPKMITIEPALSDDLDRIHADPVQMDQVLMNLSVNARDAMPKGGKLVIETANVVIDEDYARSHLEANPGKYVLLRVADTGQGIDRETMNHIFEPFYTTKGPGEGTGLGLAMVFGIVKQHGGFINCYSEVGHGTTFSIYLPAVIGGTQSDQPVVISTPQGGQETILLVDDEELIRDLGKRILRKAGYRVLTAINGKEALDLYRSNQGEISLVILDLIMPEMGGEQCLKELLKIDPQIKALMASGFAISGDIKAFLDTEAKGRVAKPFNIRDLLRSVRHVLDET